MPVGAQIVVYEKEQAPVLRLNLRQHFVYAAHKVTAVEITCYRAEITTEMTAPRKLQQGHGQVPFAGKDVAPRQYPGMGDPGWRSIEPLQAAPFGIV